MKELGLAARIRRKRKYSSYKGEVGKKADNLIQHQFECVKPYEKCYTDVTKFALSRSPELMQVQTMLEKAFPAKHYGGTILHRDQGLQYQHQSYHHFWESVLLCHEKATALTMA